MTHMRKICLDQMFCAIEAWQWESHTTVDRRRAEVRAVPIAIGASIIRLAFDGMSPTRVSRIPHLLALCSLYVCRSHADSILIKASFLFCRF